MWTVALSTGAMALLMLTPKAMAQGGSCRDPWINSAYNQLYHRAPQGSGDSGECNPALYGGGHWSNFADLEAKIRASKNDSGTRAPSPDTLLVGRYGNLYNYWGEVVQKTGTYMIQNNSDTSERVVGVRLPNAGEVIHLPPGENGRNFRRTNGYGKMIIANMLGRGRR